MTSSPTGVINHTVSTPGDNDGKHSAQQQRNLLEYLQDSFDIDFQSRPVNYLHDMYNSQSGPGSGVSIDKRVQDWRDSLSSGTSASDYDIQVAATNIPAPINSVGKHLHIPANVTLRAERRARRAYSCPPPVGYQQQHNIRSPEILENGITPRHPDNIRVRLERSGSRLSVTSFAVRGTTRREKLILLSLAIVDFLSNMCLSVLAPFFPKEAADRNISDTVSGWIFGVFALVQFLASPVFGKLLPKVGSRFMFISGVFLGGGGTVLFGALYYFPYERETLFLVFCFILRVVIGLGCTASNTASFAIMADTFPDNVGSVFGILETFTGLGLMVGPALGGVLYQAGNFFLPFCVLGGIMLTGVPLCSVILPEENDFEAIVAQGNTRGPSYQNLLRMPIVLAVCASVVSAALVWSLLDPVLEPHLRDFNLSTAVVGLIFLLSAAFYAISAPVWGWITDKVRDSCILLSLGFLLSAVALLFLGPSQLLGFGEDYNELWLNLLSLIVLGASVSLASVPTFEKILDVAEQEGVEDGLMLYGTVAGIWGSANALGEFIGPSIGGTLVSAVTFGWTMTICSGVCLFMSFVNLICWCYNSPCWKKRRSNSSTSTSTEERIDERTPLLNPVSANDITNDATIVSVESSNCEADDEDASESDSDDGGWSRNKRMYNIGDCNDNNHIQDPMSTQRPSQAWELDRNSC